ncbi:MAG: NADH dehydrogenase [Candidatus Poribacteria bacterium]|nr:MAG: NADH dehydrogenase [Candidatus Poribacteria bacterium]
MERARVVIVGGGFGGLEAARALGGKPVEVTLIDRRNFHLFQPLLYQVATGGLSEADIAAPLRAILKGWPNITVRLGTAVDLNPEARLLLLEEREAVPYDFLILAAGSRHHYFGHPEWEPEAPGLKTLEDALEVRRRVFLAFEEAERVRDPQEQGAWLRFVIAGGGPTGVELAGALGELTRGTLPGEFRRIRPESAEIVLVEAQERLLPGYRPAASARATRALNRLGVRVLTKTRVLEISSQGVRLQQGEKETILAARTVLWAAGNRAAPLTQTLQERCGATLDRNGRVFVREDLSLPHHPEIFIVGDTASVRSPSGDPLPAIAPVAVQEGRYAARAILARMRGERLQPFRYRSPGAMAVIGRHEAVVQTGRGVVFGGFLAWLVWLLVHIRALVGFENKLVVFVRWAWSYFTRNPGSRLILDLPEKGEPQ